MSDEAEHVSQDQNPINEVVEENPPQQTQNLTGKKVSLNNLRRFDSFDVESAKFGQHGGNNSKDGGWRILLQLAFQSIGVVYGDLGTSCLYVFPSVFRNGVRHNEDILGVLSMILYTVTLIPVVKYVFIVLQANDNGDGGTFALYSLICRYAKVGLIPNQPAEDREVSIFKLELPNGHNRSASKLKSKLENSNSAKFFLLFATMLGTSMVIGDGVLTPCISVLSAVSGIKKATKKMDDKMIVWIAVTILVFLFMLQRFGTDKVGYIFAPVLVIWFAFISSIGIYNFMRYDPSVIKALNPIYIVEYFRRNNKEAWISLGGVVLCITGTEALFADVGHFSVRSIQMSMCTVIYPALIFAYTGQASYLHAHEEFVKDAFYASIPRPVYWPMFVTAVLASIIASQAMISGTFSIVQQSLSLGCFPRVKIVHTSAKYPGQIYIPEINYLLMFACICVTLLFGTSEQIGNAYGISVVFVMVLTSAFMVLVMVLIWKTHVLLIIAYVSTIGVLELVYLSSVLYKFDKGGYLPLAFALFLVLVMYVWNDVYRRKYHFELENKISPEQTQELVRRSGPHRLPGIAVFYSELVHGIPPIFEHYVANVPAIHSVLVFVSFKSLPISKVPLEERFFFRRVKPNDLRVFRCVVRYGYTDARNEQEPFEKALVERLSVFVREDCYMSMVALGQSNGEKERACNEEGGGEEDGVEVEKEMEYLDEAWERGVVHMVGEHEVVACKGANVAKRLLIDYGYNFMKRNLRQSNRVFDIPQKRILKVGMTYEL